MSETTAKRAAAAFNKQYPVGTLVRYWPWTRQYEPRVGKTRAAAAVMYDHASVWIEGVAGSISLSHVEVIEEATDGAK